MLTEMTITKEINQFECLLLFYYFSLRSFLMFVSCRTFSSFGNSTLVNSTFYKCLQSILACLYVSKCEPITTFWELVLIPCRLSPVIIIIIIIHCLRSHSTICFIHYLSTTICFVHYLYAAICSCFAGRLDHVCLQLNRALILCSWRRGVFHLVVMSFYDCLFIVVNWVANAALM